MSRHWDKALAGILGASTAVFVVVGIAAPSWADGGQGQGHSGTAAQGSDGADNGSSSPSGPGGQTPPGNNGTVKINDESVPNQDNDPHVGCNFSVSFYGYDAGSQSASLTFSGHPPTRTAGSYGTTTSWNVATRTGGNQLDQTLPVTFSELSSMFTGVQPAHQGFHVKLTVAVTGSRGSDTKHKVFWIRCGQGTTGPSSGAGPSGVAGASTVSGEALTARSAEAPGAPTAASSAAPSATTAGAKPGTVAVLGESISRPLASSATAPGATVAARALSSLPAAPRPATAVRGVSELSFTGFETLGAVTLAGGLVGAGGGLVALSRRRRRR